MARIRSIKPEFPQSESMGRVSRDARLLFIQLWPICDDHGRTRAASRMLASLLFPYDDDAPSLIEGWLRELEGEGCIRRYVHDGSAYLEICNWLIHQKIDKPSKPQFPAFDESSRILASPREHSSLDLDLDQGKDQGREKRKAKAPDASDDGSPVPRRKPKPPPAAARPVVEIPDWIPGDAWQGFADMRRRIRKPMTPRAAELIVRKLHELRRDGHDPGAVLDQSCRNGWQDVFAIKGERQQRGSTAEERIRRAAEDFATHGGGHA